MESSIATYRGSGFDTGYLELANSAQKRDIDNLRKIEDAMVLLISSAPAGVSRPRRLMRRIVPLAVAMLVVGAASPSSPRDDPCAAANREVNLFVLLDNSAAGTLQRLPRRAA